VYAGVRRPLLHTRNLADLIPASAVWAGAPHNEHLAHVTGLERAHIYTTTGSTPFRVNTNVDDLGNAAIFGPPGSGKSTLLAVLGLQHLKYPRARVVHFDVHRSGRAAALANDGICYEPGDPHAAISFQPLAAIDDAGERIWAASWLSDVLALQNVQLTPKIKRAIDDTLTTLALDTPERRTLTTAADLLGSHIPALREALRPYTVVGNYGQIFDAQSDSLQPRIWTLFEMSHLMNLGPDAVLPALAYLIHRVERWFDGSPTLLMLDECWRFMSHAMFAEWFQKGLKTLRKNHVYVYFATQEVSDLARHKGLLSTVLSACPTLIFGADEAAATPSSAAVYRDIGLSDTEIKLLARAQRKRDYYYRSPRGRRIFSLSLGPATLAFAGMASPEDQRFLDRMIAERDPREYALAMLEYREVEWAIQELRARAGGRDSRSVA
jgi:type IV secretion system protein VirB4